ncbi:MAG: class I SAM-dependent methyltransferase [Rhodospirillales bacterium]|nr:class I SAM-dependent methyltransferase [Rhodospirillales bacterium]
MTDPGIERWNERFAQEGYVFGEQPNAFLARQKERLRGCRTALSIADGEGRNGVWLAEMGLAVTAVEGSPVGQEKARQLAARRGVALDFVLADLAVWEWPERRFDAVVGIFFQFAGPALRERIFAGMRRALKPGGLLIVEGYRPEQIAYGTGGPKVVENLYTEPMLREACAGMSIELLETYDAVIDEGSGHHGMSALIDLVARAPA